MKFGVVGGRGRVVPRGHRVTCHEVALLFAFLLLHSAILKPDFYLEKRGKFNSTFHYKYGELGKMTMGKAFGPGKRIYQEECSLDTVLLQLWQIP